MTPARIVTRAARCAAALCATAFFAACTGGGGGGSTSDAGPSTDGVAPATDSVAPGTDGAPGDGPLDMAPPADPYALPAEVSSEALRDAFGRARCGFDARCGVGFAGTDPALCVRVAGAYAWHVEAIERLRAAGRLEYDPGTMAECLTWLADRPCEAVGRAHGVRAYRGGRDYFIRERDLDWVAHPACRRALLAAGGPDAPCLHEVECATGTCYNPFEGCGRCIGLGSTCGEAYCADEERCNFETSECLPRLGPGEPCVNDGACRSDLRCGPEPEPGTCMGLGPVGRACDDDNHNSGLCPVASDCRADVCEALDVRFADEGEPCSEGSQFDEPLPACRPDLICRGGEGEVHTCAPHLAGDRCSWGGFTGSRLASARRCGLDLVCNSDDVCAAPQPVDGRCTDSRDCDRTLHCDRDTRTCRPRLGRGAVCSAYPTGGQCAYPLNCVGSRIFGMDDGTCQPGAALGAPCGGKEDCAPDLYCNDERGVCVYYDFGASYFGCGQPQ